MKIVTLFLLTIFPYSAFGQVDLLEKSGPIYMYKDELFRCKDLGEVYYQHHESMELYMTGRKYNRAANVAAIFGIPVAFVGVLAFTSDTFGGAKFGVQILAISVIMELVALIPRLVAKIKLQKARNVFNFEMIERHGYQSEISLSIGATSNGLGLIYQF